MSEPNGPAATRARSASTAANNDFIADHRGATDAEYNDGAGDEEKDNRGRPHQEATSFVVDDDDEEAEMQSIHYVSLPSGDSNASAGGWPTRSHRSSLSRIATHSSSNVTFLSFLIVSTHKWYWPLVLSVRSVILAAVTGLFSYDSVFLPLCVFLLLIGSLLLHVLNKPFVLQVDNWLETLVFAASIMMYLAQMLIGLGLNQSGLSAFTSVVSLLVLLALFAGLAATIIMHRRAKAKM